MRIAVCLPTRGLIFAETIKALIKELKPYEYELIIVSGLPIPDSHNTCVEEALVTDCNWILFLEEDIVLPEGAIKLFKNEIQKGAKVVIIDYPIEGSESCVIKKDGKLLWGPLGCTLIAREVFEDMPRPWFRTDKTLLITNEKTFEYKIQDVPNKYGGHDILFYLYLRQKGIPVGIVEGVKAKHLRLESWERKTMNNGVHKIYELEGGK